MIKILTLAGFVLRGTTALLLVMVALLSGCAQNPNTGMNGLQRMGYALMAVDAGGRGYQPAPAAVGGVAGGQQIYSYDECIGPVIMGKCNGSIAPTTAYHPTCHGEWLNGVCTGPMF